MRSRTSKPWWLRQKRREPLVDLYTPTWIRMWLAVEGGSFEQVAEDGEGDLPAWYEDVNELGWNSILGKYDFGGGGWADDLNWLVAHGIAPEQPFLVHLDKPRWYKSGGYEYPEEWDCEYDPEIIRVAVLAPSVVAKRWEKAIESEQTWRKSKAEREERLRYLTRTNTKAMFISSDWYFAPGQSLYDDMEMPRGVRYTLCSSASLERRNTFSRRDITAQLAVGEDNEGCHERAMADMVQDALVKLPGLSAEFIRALPVQSSGW